MDLCSLLLEIKLIGILDEFPILFSSKTLVFIDYRPLIVWSNLQLDASVLNVKHVEVNSGEPPHFLL